MSKLRPFTKLKKIIDSLFDPKLKMEFCCISYPLRSQYGSSNIPRFYLKMNNVIIWDFPKDFPLKEWPFYYWMDDNGIVQLVRDYIDTPINVLLEKEFPADKFLLGTWGPLPNGLKPATINLNLVDLFKAADRRLGKEKLLKWSEEKRNPKVVAIIYHRYIMGNASSNSFADRARWGTALLSIQPPVTLKQARAQVKRLHENRLSKNNTSSSNSDYSHLLNLNKNYESFNISTRNLINNTINNIEYDTIPLSDICEFSLGLIPYDKSKGHSKTQIAERVFHSSAKLNETYQPLLSADNITKYNVSWDGRKYISYGSWLANPREKKFFTSPRILVRHISDSGKPCMCAAYTEDELYNSQIAFNFLLKENSEFHLKYILSVLNSVLMNFYCDMKFRHNSEEKISRIFFANVKRLPVKILSPRKQKPFIITADKIIMLNKTLYEINENDIHGKNKTEKEIKEIEEKIDNMIFKIYRVEQEMQGLALKLLNDNI